MTELLWLLVVAGGPVVIGALIAFALLNRRPLTPGERTEQRRGTERAYRVDEPKKQAEARH